MELLSAREIDPLASEDDDTASVDIPSTQEDSAKGDDEDDEDEVMTEEDDDEGRKLVDSAKNATAPRAGRAALPTVASALSSNVAGASGTSASANTPAKRMKKRVRISDISTVHGGGNSDHDDDVNRESTAEEDNDDDEDDDEMDDEDDEMEDDDEDDDEDTARKKQELQQQQAALDKIELSDSASMLRMIQSLPEHEARRHEQFRRSHFERGAIKRCMTKVIQECSAADKRVPSVNNVMAIVMAGMTKVFVGELTAEARRIMEQHGETGPIRPHHLREAHRKYYARRPLARGRNLRRLLR